MEKLWKNLPFAFIPQKMQKFSLEGNYMHKNSVWESIGPHSLVPMWELTLKTHPTDVKEIKVFSHYFTSLRTHIEEQLYRRIVGKSSFISQSLLYKWENILERSSRHVRNMKKCTFLLPPLITTCVQTLERDSIIIKQCDKYFFYFSGFTVFAIMHMVETHYEYIKCLQLFIIP